MAICPECFSMEKSFFAPRCSECNEYIEFSRQCICSWVYANTMIVGFFFVIGSVFMGWQWGLLAYYVIWVLIPAVFVVVIPSGFLALLASGTVIWLLTAVLL